LHAARSNLAEIFALNPVDPTSSSLLRRAMAREPEAWERLVTLYSPLVHHWCRQWGIAQHEIADVTQEVFAAVASSLGQFRPEEPGTTFRGWMRGITRHKLLHHASSRGEPAIGGTDAQVRLRQVPAPANEVELSEAPADVTGLYQRALRLVQHQVEDRTWTAFWKATVESRATAEVAAELGITPNAVRLAKSHVLRRLREEMGELIA
jgi:RNA polymerase sigma-70 factor (ECF subfamily)